MKDVAWCGRLFGISLTGSHQSPVQTTRCAFSPSAGAANCASAAPTSNSSTGSDTPLMCQCPCDTSLCADGAERVARRRREQRLAAAGERHHPRRDRLGQALDLERLGAAGDVVGGVLAQDHRPDVQADARHQRHRQRRQRAVVLHRVADRVGAVVEQQQHAVGLVDLAAAPRRQQGARDPVVRGPDLGHRGIAELLGHLRAVDDIRQQQGLDLTHRHPPMQPRDSKRHRSWRRSLPAGPRLQPGKRAAAARMSQVLTTSSRLRRGAGLDHGATPARIASRLCLRSSTPAQRSPCARRAPSVPMRNCCGAARASSRQASGIDTGAPARPRGQ